LGILNIFSLKDIVTKFEKKLKDSNIPPLRNYIELKNRMNGNNKRIRYIIAFLFLLIACLGLLVRAAPANCDTANGSFCAKCSTSYILATTRADGAFDLCLKSCIKGYKKEDVDYKAFRAGKYI
jgi:hypothetical protein